MEGVTGMMARLSHMQRVAAGGSAMYRTRVFFSDRVRATVATSRTVEPGLSTSLLLSPLGLSRLDSLTLSLLAPQPAPAASAAMRPMPAQSPEARAQDAPARNLYNVLLTSLGKCRRRLPQ